MEDPTPAPPAPGEYGGPLHSTELWLGLLVIVCAVIVLVLQRRRAAAAAPRVSGHFPSETVQVDQTAREVAPESTIAEASSIDAPAFATVAAGLEREIEALSGQAGGVHSHKRLRRHPELATTNGTVSDADV